MTRLTRVLCVDDSEADQLLARYAIHEHDASIEVRLAYDGVEALEILGDPSFEPDLVLLDINMPRMNGFEFLERWSRRRSAASVPIVMLSSSLHEADRVRAESFASVRGFMGKPIEPGWATEVERLIGTTD